MSQAPKFTAELHKLCGKLRDNEITDSETLRLNEILRASRSARKFYRTFMALASALETRTSVQDFVDQESDSDKNIDVLFELLQLEQDAEVQVVELPRKPKVSKPKSRRSRKESIGWHEVYGASACLLTHAAKSAPAKWLAAAAVIALGVLLAVQFIGPATEPTPNPITDNTNIKPAESALPILRDQTVATLTATHNATWAQASSAPGSLTPGSKLHPGQRLTLTAGFAEITTNDGAIAILEAPATIELLDNNALRLHAGKLVGICETESSKGLLVRTPHLDVTDLGTEFTVTSDDQSDETNVRVHLGKVLVSPSPGDGDRQASAVLSAGQAVVSGADFTLRQAGYVPDGRAHTKQAIRFKPWVTSGLVIFDANPPHDLRQGQSVSDRLQVYLERSDMAMPRDLEIDMAGLDRWPMPIDQPDRIIEAGKRVDVYLLHMDQTGLNVESHIHELDFGRPILGVIASADKMIATDPVFDPADRYRFDNTPDSLGEVLRGIEPADSLRLLPNGTALQVQMFVTSKTDQVRVLVEAAPTSD